MKCSILHESRGRMRVHMAQQRMTLAQADLLEYYLAAQPGVTGVRVYDRTCDAVICYSSERSQILAALSGFSYAAAERTDPVPEETGRALRRSYEDKIVWTVLRRIAGKLLLPQPVRECLCLCRSVKYFCQGLRCLLAGRLEVPVLDATAVTVSVLRGDYATASSVMFLLHIGEILEEWTHKKSVDDLARTMSLGVERVWLHTPGGQDVLVPVSQVRAGDTLVIRMGSMIPLDGRIIRGEAAVNQASMTGESMPVHKRPGDPVYAGTVVEDGECLVTVEKTSGMGRYDRIVRMIEDSERLKSAAESRAGHLADRLVPYSLGGTLLTWLVTRNAAKALSILMVDFSCALKLAMPVAVLSAMRECSRQGITVKGGRFMEAVSAADTIVFDKTGTLTYAEPTVAQVIPFDGRDPDEMLRLAACLEEHYPHSIATSVVREAERRGLLHEERHSRVEYVVAHGISSTIDGEKVVIGSYHFVFEDEGAVVPAGEEERFADLPVGYSCLYLAISGRLSAVLCIADPLRSEAPDVIGKLRTLGLSRIVMMTGDSERTAHAVAQQVGVDICHAEVLPEDKAAFIRQAHEEGHTVIMIGDGVNDSPALSEADAGIAISTGAAIAREIADITISSEDLYPVVQLRRYSDALMQRIRWNYRTIIGFNLGLIVLGVAGILPPSVSAFLHNASTLAIGLRSMTPLPVEHE